MYREGYVNRIVDGHVEISLIRHSACSQCGGCSMGSAEAKTEIILALNKANAVAGDYVQLHLPDANVASAALTAYGIPLVFMMGFMVVGSQLGFQEGGALVFGILGLVGSYLLNKFLLEPRRVDQNKYKVIAERIIAKEDVEGEI